MRNICAWLCALALLAGVVACEPGMGEEECGGDAACAPDPKPNKSRAPAKATVPRCSQDIPFEPTYLPDGFGHKLFEGRFPGGRPLDEQSSIGGKRHEEQVVVHYRGFDGRAIEIRRPGTIFTELAQRSDTPRIEVLGTETTGFAPIQPRGNKFIVQFRYPPGTRPHQWCSLYSLNEYGVSLAELKKVAEGLRIRSSDEP